MPFGGMSPMPLRLGAQSDTSISPENWLRLCDDVAAQHHPLAVLYIAEGAGAGACAVTGISMGGTDVAGSGITATLANTSGTNWQITISVGPGYIDPETLELHRWSVSFADPRPVGGVFISLAGISTNNDVLVTYDNARTTPLRHVVTIYGTTEQRWSGDYGAEPSKSRAGNAADVPYAWVWLQELQVTRGDAFSVASGSFTQMENVALARGFAYLQDIAERHASNQLPTQADQSLGRWATIMNVGTTDDRDWQVRRKCAAKYALTTTGATAASLNAAATLLFGGNFYGINWTLGTVDYPPEATFWPPGFTGDPSPGPGALDIGNGVWTSSRFHFTVELTAANEVEATRLIGIAHRDFDEMLQASLPPVVTWDYRFNPTNGFILDTSRMDREAL